MSLLWIVIVVLLLLWLFGLIGGLGGISIHLLLIIAVCVLVYLLISSRRGG